jgi:WD40 repeat protein
LECNYWQVFITEAFPGIVRSMAWSSDGRFLAIGTFDSTVKPLIEIWETRDDRLQQVSTLEGHHSMGYASISLAWSQDGLYLATAAADGNIII